MRQKSSPFREAAGALKPKIDSLQRINPNAKVITLGDLNDGPYNKSVRMAWRQSKKGRSTPAWDLLTIRRNGQKGFGTIAFGCMGYFDQIMVSEPTANGLFELDIGKQEFTTSHF
jgi:hypothetical protein